MYLVQAQKRCNDSLLAGGGTIGWAFDSGRPHCSLVGDGKFEEEIVSDGLLIPVKDSRSFWNSRLVGLNERIKNVAFKPESTRDPK